MRSLLTTNFLGVAITGKNLFSIEFEKCRSILHLDENEQKSIVHAILSDGYTSILLRESQHLAVSVQKNENKVTLCWIYSPGTPTATFNIDDFLNLFDPDMVISVATGIREGKTPRPVPPKPGKMLYKR